MKVYLGIVDDDFELTDEVTQYFKAEEVEVLKFFKSLSMIKLGSEKSLNVENLNYVKYLEEDQTFTTAEEE